MIRNAEAFGGSAQGRLPEGRSLSWEHENVGKKRDAPGERVPSGQASSTTNSLTKPAITNADRATKARWITPEHIKPMSENTPDFDWWFAQIDELL